MAALVKYKDDGDDAGPAAAGACFGCLDRSEFVGFLHVGFGRTALFTSNLFLSTAIIFLASEDAGCSLTGDGDGDSDSGGGSGGGGGGGGGGSGSSGSSSRRLQQ